ncbi:MAG: hypothetical protein D6808_05550 [Candidatus Dadabacteria bacterium]|nr:MAG: hypothetical protein D6808_05550 [Candidatus Dadabacteria bacterium]
MSQPFFLQERVRQRGESILTFDKLQWGAVVNVSLEFRDKAKDFVEEYSTISGIDCNGKWKRKRGGMVKVKAESLLPTRPLLVSPLPSVEGNPPKGVVDSPNNAGLQTSAMAVPLIEAFVAKGNK